MIPRDLIVRIRIDTPPPGGARTARRAGQLGSRWSRRAKVSLEGLRPLLAQERDETTVTFGEATIGGTSRDGGPACASLPLLGGGWMLGSDSSRSTDTRTQ